MVIQEGEFSTWKLDDIDFPHRNFANNLAGAATAVAVLNKEDKLVGVAVGRVKNDGTFIADGIKHNDGTIDTLDQKSRISVEIDLSGKNIKIKPEGVEILSKAVTDSVKKHNLGKAKAAVGKSDYIIPLGDDIILYPPVIPVVKPYEQKKVPHR